MSDVIINNNAMDNVVNDIDTYYKMNCNMQLYRDDNINTNLSIFLKNFEIPDYVEGEKSYTMKDADVNRLDVISYKYYGTPELFWIIMMINNIVDPFDIPSGTVLRLLPKDYIVYNILRVQIFDGDLI